VICAVTHVISGCGPIGLITAAVAHAYSARKIIGIDNSPFRVEFAKKYISPLTGKPIFDAVFLNTDLPTESLKHPPRENTNVGTDGEVGDATAVNEDDHETVGDIKWEHAKLRVQGWVKELGLEEEEGVDRVVEASGAEDCMLLGVAFAKQGGTCTSLPPTLLEKS
jgi:D-xylulose reductase